MVEGRHMYRYVTCIVVTVLLFLFVSYCVLDNGQNPSYTLPSFQQSARLLEISNLADDQEQSSGDGTSSQESGYKASAGTAPSSQASSSSPSSGFSSSFESATSSDVNGNTSALSLDKLTQFVEAMEQTLSNMTFISDRTFPEGFKLKLLPNYKTPCFKEDRALWCLPYFFIGGFPKCGTTELFAKLIQHPHIFKGKKKEPHWWTRYRYKRRDKKFDFYRYFFKRNLRNVERTVDKNGYHPLILTEGSASTVWDNSYLFSRNTYDIPPHLNIHAIHSVLPDAKFVLILRNPVTRLYSDYLYFQRKYSPENFHAQVVRTLELFNECLQDVRKSFLYCVYAPPPSHAPPLYFRLRIALYYVHLKVVLSVYPRSNIFVLQLEEYMQDEVTWLRKIMSFLDVTLMSERDITQVINRRKAANSNKKGYKKSGPMLSETKMLLEAFYKPFNTHLKTLLGEGYMEY